jgi:hypothetical protein
MISFSVDIFDTPLSCEVVGRFPEEDHADNPFDGAFVLFVYPNGVYLSKERREFSTHSFIMTKETGVRSYGVTFLRWRPLLPFEREAAGMTEETAAFVPEALVAISKLPIVETFKNYFVDFFAFLSPECRLSMEEVRTCGGRLKSASMSPSSILIQSPSLELTIQLPKVNEPLLCDLDYVSLFSLLDPIAVIQTLSAIVGEAKLIFVADSYSTVTNAISVFLSLLYPMEWPHVLIPVLPRNLLSIFEAPVPYLVGVSRIEYEQNPATLLDVEDLLIVDLDNNKLEQIRPRHLFLPPRTAVRLFRAIKQFANYYETTHPDAEPQTENSVRQMSGSDEVQPEIHVTLKTWNALNESESGEGDEDEEVEYPELFLVKHLEDASTCLDPSMVDAWSAIGQGDPSWTAEKMFRLKEAFVNVFVSLFKMYRQFLVIPSEEDPGSASLFDDSSFIAEASLDSVSFLELTLSTQTFHYFIQDRVTRKEDDWFDCLVKEKVRRMAVFFSIFCKSRNTGYLTKQGHVVKNWKRRYFRLEGSEIQYYIKEFKSTEEKEKEKLRRGLLYLPPDETRVCIPKQGKKSFPSEYPFEIQTPVRNLLLCAETAEERRSWIKAVKARTNLNRMNLVKKILPKEIVVQMEKRKAEHFESVLALTKQAGKKEKPPVSFRDNVDVIPLEQEKEKAEVVAKEGIEESNPDNVPSVEEGEPKSA